MQSVPLIHLAAVSVVMWCGMATARADSGPTTRPMLDQLNRETVARVRQAIDRLPEHFRAALVLCEYENMAYVQIAEVLGASIPQVKTWLHRGRRQLARMLAELDPADDKAQTRRRDVGRRS